MAGKYPTCTISWTSRRLQTLLWHPSSKRGSCLWRSNWTRYLLMIVSVLWMCHLTSVMRRAAVLMTCTRHQTTSFLGTQPQWRFAFKLPKSRVNCIHIVSIGVQLQWIWRSDGAVHFDFRIWWRFAIWDGTMTYAENETNLMDSKIIIRICLICLEDTFTYTDEQNIHWFIYNG